MTPENIQEMYSAIKADPDGDGELIPRHSSVPVSLLSPVYPASRVARDEEVRIQPGPHSWAVGWLLPFALGTV